VFCRYAPNRLSIRFDQKISAPEAGGSARKPAELL
jgi:hypothetical protein